MGFSLRLPGSSNNPWLRYLFLRPLRKRAVVQISAAKAHLNEGSSSESRGGVEVFHLGLSDVADKLGPAVDEAVKKHRVTNRPRFRP